MPPEPPQLPSRIQPTEKPVTLQPLRIASLPKPEVSQVANIFASVIKGTTEFTESLVEAERKVTESFHVDLDVNLAKAADLVAADKAAALAEGREPRSERDILREEFGNNRDNLNAMIRSAGRIEGEQRANQIDADYRSRKNVKFGDLFRDARVEAAADQRFANDPVRLEGYMDRLVETETKLNKDLITRQMQEADLKLKADQVLKVNESVIVDMNKYVDEHGALLLEGDEPEPFAIHKNALNAYSLHTWNKPFDDLSSGLQAQAMGFVIPQMFSAMAEMGHIKAEDKDTIIDRQMKAILASDAASLEFKRILRKERKTYDDASVASTNAVYSNRISELMTGLEVAETIPQVQRQEALLSRSFDPNDTEAFGRIPMGVDDLGQITYSGKISPTMMSNLGVKYRALIKKNERNLQIEATLVEGNSPALKKGDKGDDKYLDAEYIRRLETMTRPEAMVDMIRHFKSLNALTPTMVSEINAIWNENRAEAMAILDSLREERPDIVNSADLRDSLDSDIRDTFNVISLGGLKTADVLSQVARSDFTSADYALIKTEVDTWAGKLKPPDGPEFFGLIGSEPIRSRQAKDLHLSAAKFFKRLGQTDDEAKTNADSLYLKSTESLPFNKQNVVVITSPVNVAEGSPPGGFVMDQNENFVYDEVAKIFDLASQLDKWDSTTSINVQDVSLSEDRRNWQYKVIENTDGLASKDIKIFNVPVDDEDRAKLARVLQDAIRQRDISGGGTGVPTKPLSVGNILKRVFVALPTPTFSRAEGIGFQFGGPIELLRDVFGKEIRESKEVQTPAFFDREDEGLSRFR